LERRLAEAEKQQGEASSTEIPDIPQCTNMNDFMLHNRTQQSVTAILHPPSSHTNDGRDQQLEDQGASGASSALSLDVSLEDIMNGQDLYARSVFHTERQDSAMDTGLFENSFPLDLSNPSPDLNTVMFNAQGSLGGTVDMGPFDKVWAPFDQSDLICADL
jgi:hypothetical protein